MSDWIILIAAAALVVLGILWRNKTIEKIKAEDSPPKLKRIKTLSTIIAVIGAYLFATRLLTIVFGSPEKEEFTVSMWAERVEVLGFNLSTTIVYTWYVMAFLIIAALILRFTLIRHMKDEPSGAQNVLEIVIESVVNYVDSKAHGLGQTLGPYIFTIAAFLVGCAFIEMFGVHTPSADITLTFTLALITFVLINFHGFKRKGFLGRFKSLGTPSPAILPLRIISDLAVPVSLSARLFGNMLGGMIVMDLIYHSMGNLAVGIPSVLGLFFNVFHPLIQAFIFVTLTLTFINEAIE